MKTLTGIPADASARSPAGAEPREPRSPAPVVPDEDRLASLPGSRPSARARSGTPDPASGDEVAVAAERLQETLNQLPGPLREVSLRFEGEDHDYVVEVRDKQSGHVIQRFPPEKLLNQALGPADLLGTVIDRRS